MKTTEKLDPQKPEECIVYNAIGEHRLEAIRHKSTLRHPWRNKFYFKCSGCNLRWEEP